MITNVYNYITIRYFYISKFICVYRLVSYQSHESVFLEVASLLRLLPQLSLGQVSGHAAGRRGLGVYVWGKNRYKDVYRSLVCIILLHEGFMHKYILKYAYKYTALYVNIQAYKHRTYLRRGPELLPQCLHDLPALQPFFGL